MFNYDVNQFNLLHVVRVAEETYLVVFAKDIFVFSNNRD